MRNLRLARRLWASREGLACRPDVTYEEWLASLTSSIIAGKGRNARQASATLAQVVDQRINRLVEA